MADLDLKGHLVWRVARMRDLQQKGEERRPWEDADLILLEREVDQMIAAYFAEELMPEPPEVKGAPKT